MDLQKAFDTVPHSRLITKLQNYGITGKTLDVIADFLSGRSFTVRVGNSHSKYHDVTSGVPQGSVLGPLLFVLYVNDLPEGIRSSISLFADDVKMYAPASSVTDTQIDIDRLHQWQLLWLLKFNTTDGKCKVMHAGINNPHNNYYLDGILLPTVDSEKDLGVYVNSKLDWSDHIAASIKKANACISWISRTMITRDASVMINLYKSLVRPHLEYCVQLWSPKPRYGNWKVIMDIENVQRRYTRLIDGIGLRTYGERLNALSLTTLLERRARGDLIETFKIVGGLVSYGSKFFNISRSGKLIYPANYGKFSQRTSDFFSKRVVNYWNKLPSVVRNSKSVDQFKVNLENFKRTKHNVVGNYWELSDEVLNRIKDDNRRSHTEYLLDHPFVAKFKGINIRNS